MFSGNSLVRVHCRVPVTVWQPQSTIRDDDPVLPPESTELIYVLASQWRVPAHRPLPIGPHRSVWLD